MNWKFWEWESLKEDEFHYPAPATYDQYVTVPEEPVEILPANPEAERIRQQLLANRK